MTKRPASEAIAILRSAGYVAFMVETQTLHARVPYIRTKPQSVFVCDRDNAQTLLQIIDGCVDNAGVETLLKAAKP